MHRMFSGFTLWPDLYGFTGGDTHTTCNPKTYYSTANLRLELSYISFSVNGPEAYLKPSQESMMELFCKNS